LLHTPLFNASMAPNGMMQVWSGLLLRVENEAQLAAVLGHEIGHYLERHSVERLRDVRSRTAFAQFLGMFGLAGAIGQLALLASAFGFSRDQERDADRIGVTLMREAGYDLSQAARVWENLLLELKARPDGLQHSPMFATHPSPEERKDALLKLAVAAPGGVTGEREWNDVIQPYRMDLLKDEIQRGQHEESIVLFSRMMERFPALPELPFARAEVYRSRASREDYDLAIRDYLLSMGIGAEPAEVHRGMGLILRARKQMPEARESLGRYLERASAAPDAPMIRSYLKEMEP
jgi:beta-barrel assembly-enhancing protease